MKIAISSIDGKTICGDAGSCQGFLIYEISTNQTIHQTYIELSREQILKNLTTPISDIPDHPLTDINAFITQSIEKELQSRLESDDIKVVKTKDHEPLMALNQIELTCH
ncbi:NifB/NifX family molybdenum-iron cluster-binding protein [Thiomicrorhabdus xiamenensis]|uniref:Dinitrogenase iron-molybdenum cofactor biosynthesis domain-containing protein n=1 Tax=Thiomicrorhabdus xiamenensis TaxID=2739063 RepID=A0A7D4SRU2_9GAMM|nr:hypothetical protein [Thiomicrorhabdus xiamenensis]QKI88783.1 hypothetical protein HQN79_03975 [Thiomicrorhabdus xiamenensis]